jgi:hypothetical protein
MNRDENKMLVISDSKVLYFEKDKPVRVSKLMQLEGEIEAFETIDKPHWYESDLKYN